MEKQNWWHNAVIYQIYPRSFNDSNGDGLGDLPGITERLDYIADLGADAIWISPFFSSPQKDFGYDISDYCDVHRDYGSMADFDVMIDKAHKLGLKLMIDLVVSHCSDEHPWFIESRQDKTNSKADWFVWHDPRPDGTEPNNWLSFFGGRAWSWDSRRQQYYLHNFLKAQPNLNYSNPEVVEAMLNTARFWFNHGVDGLRLDAIHSLKADWEFPDNLPVENPEPPELPQARQPFFRQRHDTAQLNQPAIQNFTAELRKVADEYGDIFLMGEVDGEDAIAVSDTFSQPGRLHGTYNFDLLKWHGLETKDIKAAVSEAAKRIGTGQRLTFALSNHDVPRSVSRMGKRHHVPHESFDDFQVMLTQFQTSLFGSNCLYQGEELGFEDSDGLSHDQLQDPWGIEFYPTFLGRDTCRTPMAWKTGNDHAGFSTAERPWLPVDNRHSDRAGLEQQGRPNSVFERTKAWFAWRKTQPALMDGDFELIQTGDELIAFKRSCAEQSLVCVFNFSRYTQELDGKQVPAYQALFY